MTRRIYIRHKGFTIYMGTCRVSDEQIEAAKAELAAAAAPTSSPKTEEAEAEATSTAAEE